MSAGFSQWSYILQQNKLYSLGRFPKGVLVEAELHHMQLLSEDMINNYEPSEHRGL